MKRTSHLFLEYVVNGGLSAAAVFVLYLSAHMINGEIVSDDRIYGIITGAFMAGGMFSAFWLEVK